MKRPVLIVLCVILAGCATGGSDYGVYVEAQKSISRDATVLETGRIAALVELSKTHPDPQVRLAAIAALVQLRDRTKTVTVEQPRRSILPF